MFFLNAKQTVNEDLFPLSASIRDPMNIEVKGRTDVIASAADFIAYLRRSAPNAVNFGIVINEAANNEIGFDEAKTVNRLVEVFKTLEGGSVILFHEKDGQLTDAKKLF
jgi:pyridoxine 5'-phosphate synthase PdxJ